MTTILPGCDYQQIVQIGILYFSDFFSSSLFGRVPAKEITLFWRMRRWGSRFIKRERVEPHVGPLCTSCVGSRDAYHAAATTLSPARVVQAGNAIQWYCRSGGAPRLKAKPMSPHILIADDNRPNRILIETYVRKFGYTSNSVGDGLAAVEAVKTGTFDLILMDIQMPNMDGLAATRQIRALATPFSEIPILALTAGEMCEVESACLEAGLNGVVCKPIDVALFHAKIVSQLDGDDR